MINIKAIIYDKRGRVLSVGENSYIKTHTIQAKYACKVGMHKNIYLHAEIAAIVKCRVLERAHKISVFRFYKNGKPANAKPCKICMEAIKQSNIKLLEYTNG